MIVLVFITHIPIVLCMNKGDYIAEVFGSTVIIPANIFEESFKKV